VRARRGEGYSYSKVRKKKEKKRKKTGEGISSIHESLPPEFAIRPPPTFGRS